MISLPLSDPRYRVVPYGEILDGLALCWADEAYRSGPEVCAGKAALALDQLHRLGLPFGDGRRADQRLYDPCEVMNALKVAGEAGLCTAWDEYVAGGRRMIAEMGGASLGTPARRRFILTFRRDFDGRFLPPGAARLRIPAPLVSSTQQTRLTLLTEGVGDAAVDASQPGRVEIVLPATTHERASITVEAAIDLTATAQGAGEGPGALGDDERRLYTAPSEGLLVVSPRIRAYSDDLARGARDDQETLRRLWCGATELNLGHIHYNDLERTDPLGTLLSSRWINCHLGAALLAALCRAQGLPARVMGGFCLYPVGPYYHYWAEVHLDGRGWIPIDFAGVPLARRPDNKAWRDVFFGRLDCRLKVECFPRTFTGPTGIRPRGEWFMSSRYLGQALERRYYAVGSGDLLYRDLVSVRTVPIEA